MSMYHKDKCTREQIEIFRKKVVAFLCVVGIKPYKIKALRSYNGEIRLYKAEPAFRMRQRMGRKLIAFKALDGDYIGDKDAIEMLKAKGGDELWKSTNAPIPCANYIQVFRVDDWEEEKKAIKEFFEVIGK